MKVRRAVQIYFPASKLEMLAKIDAEAAATGLPFSRVVWELARAGLERARREQAREK